jgi:hypothetical protein
MVPETIIPAELETLLRAEFPLHADALADCWSQYMGTWIEEHFTKKRPLRTRCFGMERCLFSYS